jgi:predicted nucleotidyltransferase
MNSSTALTLLRAHKSDFSTKFDVNYLALFGSTARNTASITSDIDILVDFNGPATSKRYYGLQFFLEDLLGSPIDLVTTKALRAELRPFIEKDALRV